MQSFSAPPPSGRISPRTLSIGRGDCGLKHFCHPRNADRVRRGIFPPANPAQSYSSIFTTVEIILMAEDTEAYSA